MESVLTEKLAVCYTCCGPTYRTSALKKLNEVYSDEDNLYFLILTDNKEFFKDVKRKNVIVNELKDFYKRFPKLEQNEFFLESSDSTEYATKFNTGNYLFPFSTYRFNILQAIDHGITNVAMLCTDTYLDVNRIKESNMLHDKEMFYNAVSEWDVNIEGTHMIYIVNRLKDKFNLDVDATVRILDAAGRLYVAKDIESLSRFFNVWNDVIEYLYESKNIDVFKGHYVVNDEYILAPIYNALNLSKRRQHSGSGAFVVNHNQLQERYWRYGGDGTIKEHNDYQEFLKINNLTDNG